MRFKVFLPTRCWPTAVAVLALILVACGGDDGGNPAATAAALSTQLALEATPAKETPVPAENADAGNGDTAVADVATVVPDSTKSEPTLVPEVTEEDINATATAVAVAQELVTFGIDPPRGELAWTHPQIVLEVNDFENYNYANKNLLTVAQDFVLAADVTWNSRYAESGCGFVVRSDGEEEKLNQYIVGLTRGAQGHVFFTEQIDGEVDLDLLTDYYANGIDPRFEWQNDTTNRIAIIGQGQEFTLYSNGTLLGTVTAQAGFEEGFGAFITVNRSGGIRCQFDNAYLWKLN